MVDVHAINPKLRWLLWVELSSEEWIVLRLNGCNEGSAIWHQAVRCHIPELLQVVICLKSRWGNTKPVTVVGEVVGGKFISSIAQSLIHSSFLWLLVPNKRKTNMVEIELSPGSKTSWSGVSDHVLIAEASSPSWVEVALVVVLFELFEDILAKVIVVAITSWE